MLLVLLGIWYTQSALLLSSSLSFGAVKTQFLMKATGGGQNVDVSEYLLFV